MSVRTTIAIRTNSELELEKYQEILKKVEGLELTKKHEITELDGLKRFIYTYEYLK